MSAVSLIQSCFRHAANQQKYRNKWLSDVAWQKIMINYYNLTDFNKHNLNTALQNITLCFPLHLHMNKKRIKNKDKTLIRASFYFIEDKITTREQLNSSVGWQHIYNNYKLPRVTKKDKIGECIVDC